MESCPAGYKYGDPVRNLITAPMSKVQTVIVITPAKYSEDTESCWRTHRATIVVAIIAIVIVSAVIGSLLAIRHCADSNQSQSGLSPHQKPEIFPNLKQEKTSSRSNDSHVLKDVVMEPESAALDNQNRALELLAQLHGAFDNVVISMDQATVSQLEKAYFEFISQCEQDLPLVYVDTQFITIQQGILALLKPMVLDLKRLKERVQKLPVITKKSDFSSWKRFDDRLKECLSSPALVFLRPAMRSMGLDKHCLLDSLITNIFALYRRKSTVAMKGSKPTDVANGDIAEWKTNIEKSIETASSMVDQCEQQPSKL
jgi:hypothetical protein